MAIPYAIETEDLTKRYGDVDAVRQLNLRVPRHGITGFLGRNGAGKSSTIRMLLGISRPSSGTGLVLGRSISDAAPSRDIRRHVAYVHEDKQLYAYFTVAEMIAFTRSFYPDWRPEMERRLVAEYQLPLRRKLRSLSKGMRTKVALLLALARQPDLLILDEPSEGLDPVSIEQLLQALVTAAADGTSIFFSSHQIAEVERISDHVCVIDRGRLVIDVSMDGIREGYRRVTFGFPTDPPSIDLSGHAVGPINTLGRQVTLVARGSVDGLIARGYQLGATSVDAVPVGLREVFLDAVMEQPDAVA